MQSGPRNFISRQNRWRSQPSPGRLRSPASSRNAANDVTNAKRSYEHYTALARAAALAGDRVEAENWNQHAEHYFRMMKKQTT